MPLICKPQCKTAHGDGGGGGWRWGRSHSQEAMVQRVSQKSNKALESAPTCEGRRDEDGLLPSGALRVWALERAWIHTPGPVLTRCRLVVVNLTPKLLLDPEAAPLLQKTGVWCVKRWSELSQSRTRWCVQAQQPVGYLHKVVARV